MLKSIMRPNRPFLVGLVCWILIIGGTAGGYKAMRLLGSDQFPEMMRIFPYPSVVAEIILFGTLAAMVVCGICMYEGQGWARYVYAALMIPGLLQGFLDAPATKTPDLSRHIWEGVLALYIVSLVLLFLPLTRRFFHPPMYVDE